MWQCVCVCDYIHTLTHTNRKLPSWLELKNTLTTSLQRGNTPPKSVLDMTLNNLMVRLQSWKFGECGVTP